MTWYKVSIQLPAKGARACRTHLSLTVCPKVHAASYEVIQRRICRLIQKDGAQTGQRQPHHSSHQAFVYLCSGDPSKRPFVCEAQECDDDVYDLQNRGGFDGRVEVLGKEVEEEFGPEEAFYCAG